MSLFETKPKEIICNLSPSGNRILMHDFRSIQAAEKHMARALESLPELIPVNSESLYKLIFDKAPFKQAKFVDLEYVG